MTLRSSELIVGSGPGGSVTAGLLAEAGRDVLLVEEGPGQPAVPPAPFSLEEISRYYRNRGLNPTLGRPKIAIAEGRCLGGGSEINSGLYHRLPPETLDAWASGYGLLDAGPDRLREDFDATERSISVSHSAASVPAAGRKLRDGAAALGWSCVAAARWFRENHGAEPVRRTMSKTWIPRALAAGARVMTDCRIHTLERSGASWFASGQVSGRSVEIRADAVFACAGAIQTPLLLRRSGIRHNVGNTLAMHPTVKVVALFDDEVNGDGVGVPFYQVKEFAPRLTFGSSVASLPHLALAMLDHPGASGRVCAEWRRAAIYYAALTGPATGRVRAMPVTGDALVRYTLTPANLRDLAGGLRSLCRLLLTAGARELFPSIAGLDAVRNMDDLDRLPESLPPGRANLMAVHLFGSCPMGGSAERAAVDSWGRVWDAPGLRVNDASLFCDAPGVNPQGGVMAFAHRNTLAYLGRR